MFYKKEKKKKKKERFNTKQIRIGRSNSQGQITKVGVYSRYLALALIVWFTFIIYSLCFKLSLRNGIFFYPFNFYFSILFKNNKQIS